jgi:hypothetical protein
MNMNSEIVPYDICEREPSPESSPWQMVEHLIIAEVRLGASRTNAAAMYGKTRNMMNKHLASYPGFRARINRAEAIWKAKAEQSIVAAMPNDPHLAFKVLGVRDRANWGATLNITALSDDELARLYESMTAETQLEPDKLDEHVIDTEFSDSTDGY